MDDVTKQRLQDATALLLRRRLSLGSPNSLKKLDRVYRVARGLRKLKAPRLTDIKTLGRANGREVVLHPTKGWRFA